MSDSRKRFFSKVNVAGPDDCWMWEGALQGNKKYGRFYYQGRSQGAHRVSYLLEYGSIPEGLEIDHFMCFNTLCVNPKHLQTATRKQNTENRSGPYKNSKSGVRGVCWDKSKGRWVATVRHNDKHVHVGRFDDIKEAEAAVIAKRNELFTNNYLDRVVA